MMQEKSETRIDIHTGVHTRNPTELRKSCFAVVAKSLWCRLHQRKKKQEESIESFGAS